MGEGEQNHETGLLSAFLLDGNGGGRALDWDGIAAWQPSDGVLWVHLDRTAADAQRWIRSAKQIDDVSADTLLRREGNRPRIVRVDDALVVALRGINPDPDADPEDMPAMHMWIDSTLIVTLRRRRLLAGQRLAARVASGAGPADSGEFLVAMTQLMIEPIIPAVTTLDERVDNLQAELLGEREAVMRTSERTQLRTRLQQIRQEIVVFRRHVAPQRQALAYLYNERVSWLSERQRALLREIADYTERYVEDLDAARERAQVTQDELSNQLAETMNRTMYLLTIVSALLLPPALVTGLFGINVGGMPGVESDTAFSIVAASLPVMAVIEFWLLRRLKWI